MPGYVEKGLRRFNHVQGKTNEDQLYQYAIPNYGTKKQYAKEEDSLELLDNDGKAYVQQVLVTFLFMGKL